MITKKLFIVTGAARGIGHEICVQLIHRQHFVVAVVRSETDVAAMKLVLGDNGCALQCDVSQAEQVENMFAYIDLHFGRVDGLVNNAATIDPIGHIADTAPSEWRQSVLTNLFGPYVCVHGALPRMLAGSGGVVVNLSSGAAHKPIEGWSAYCATKAALAMFTRTLHGEYGAAGINAIGFAPGLVDTGMQSTIRKSGINPVSQIPSTDLTPAQIPARMIVRLLEGAAASYAGSELDARDPVLKAALADLR